MRRRLLGLTLCAIVCLGLRGVASAQEDNKPAEAQKLEQRRERFERLIESLASANPEPRCVRRYDERFAIFDAAYDWDDQARVLKALGELVKLEGNDAWPLLVAHLDDKRYAVTYSIDDSAINASVGDLCDKQATADLLAAYHQYCPEVKGINRLSEYWNLWAPDDDLRDGLQKWYRQRRGKALWELQIEMCEWAMSKAPGLERVSEADRQKFVADVTKEIERLKRTHEPVICKNVFRGLFFETYTPQRAQASRELYERRLQDTAEQERKRKAQKDKLDAEAKKLDE